MQTLTKTELKWIHDILKEKAIEHDNVVQTWPDSPGAYIAELRRDGLLSIMQKLVNVIDHDCKRIAIK